MCEVNSLSSRCVQVTLKRQQWLPRKWDRNITTQVEAQAGVTKVGKYTKDLLKGNKYLKDVQMKFNEIYRYVIDNSLPWMNDGARVIPADTLLDFSNEMRRLKDEAMASVSVLHDHWDEAVQADAHRMGPLFDVADYPTADEMAGRFDIKIIISPISDSGDFRIAIDEEVKQQLDKELEEVRAKATEHCMAMLLTPIKAMAEKLSIPNGEEGAIFRDSLVSNVKEAATRALKLNINDNERISETCHQVLDALSSVGAQTLRESDTTRAAVASQMRNIQNKLAAFFPGA